jgi:hypothetical protein
MVDEKRWEEHHRAPSGLSARRLSSDDRPYIRAEVARAPRVLLAIDAIASLPHGMVPHHILRTVTRYASWTHEALRSDCS